VIPAERPLISPPNPVQTEVCVAFFNISLNIFQYIKMGDVTRIIDLPENVTMQMTPGTRGDGIHTSYSPMDIHPNPYGHPPPSVPSIPMPSMQTQEQQRLPSRDIPQDQSHLIQDPEILANYIHPVSDTNKYMRQYGDAADRKLEAHKKEKDSMSRMDKLVEDGQIPILIAMMFFIFHMPIVESYLMKSFSFLSIQDLDGNFSMNGLIMRSMAFGLVYHGVTHVINTMSLL
jgi:hypothetical protein